MFITKLVDDSQQFNTVINFDGKQSMEPYLSAIPGKYESTPGFILHDVIESENGYIVSGESYYEKFTEFYRLLDKSKYANNKYGILLEENRVGINREGCGYDKLAIWAFSKEGKTQWEEVIVLPQYTTNFNPPYPLTNGRIIDSTICFMHISNDGTLFLKQLGKEKLLVPINDFTLSEKRNNNYRGTFLNGNTFIYYGYPLNKFLIGRLKISPNKTNYRLSFEEVQPKFINHKLPILNRKPLPFGK